MHGSTDTRVRWATANEPIDYVNLGDAFDFLRRHGKLIAATMLLGGFIGGLSGAFGAKTYFSEIPIETQEDDGSTLQDPDKIRAGFNSLIIQRQFAQLYAKTFVSELDSLQKKASPGAGEALRFFRAQLASDVNAPNEQLVGRFARYLSRGTSPTMQVGKLNQNFGYSVSASGTGWELAFSTDTPGISTPVTTATIAALKVTIGAYNRYEEQQREGYLLKKAEKARTAFKRMEKQYLDVQLAYEHDKARLKMDVYRLERELGQLGGKPGKSTSKYVEPALPMLIDSQGHMANALAETLEEIQVNQMIKRLVDLTGSIDSKSQEAFFERLKVIQQAKAELRAKFEATERPFMLTRDSYSRATADAAAPIQTQEFALPLVSSDEQNAAANALSVGTIDSTRRIYPLWTIIGASLGCLLGTVLSGLGSLRDAMRKWSKRPIGTLPD